MLQKMDFNLVLVEFNIKTLKYFFNLFILGQV